jgi:four helix bundle protein
MHVQHFEDLEIWKESRRLASEIYDLTLEPKFSNDFNLRNQIRSAVVSVMSNIAEGFERSGNQEFTQFLYVAKGSCGEVRSQIYVAVDQKYVSTNDSQELLNSFRRLSGMIINYLKRSGLKGAKFNKQSDTLKGLSNSQSRSIP